MPDFTALDKTILVTVLSASVTFIIVLTVGLALLKIKKRNKLKHRNKRGGKGWKNTRRNLRYILWSKIRFLRFKNMREILIILTLLAFIGLGDFLESPSPSSARNNNTNVTISCHSPYIIDGDTFDCVGTRIRLMGIDAPEMPDHCRPGRRCTKGDPFAAKEYLKSLATGWVTCRTVETDHYGRSIARCKADDVDFSCAMIASGHAVQRYSTISCP